LLGRGKEIDFNIVLFGEKSVPKKEFKCEWMGIAIKNKKTIKKKNTLFIKLS